MTPQPAQCRQSRDVGQGGHGELAWDSGVGLYRVDSPELRGAVAADNRKQEAGYGRAGVVKRGGKEKPSTF